MSDGGGSWEAVRRPVMRLWGARANAHAQLQKYKGYLIN